MAFQKKPKVDVVAETVEAGEYIDVEELWNRDGIPSPPKSILAKFKSGDKEWRWLSKPYIDRGGGWRGYEAYSPDAADRALIERGRCAPGIRISVDNLIRWNEDAFLGVIPGRLARERRRRTRDRTIDQTKTSRNPERFKEEVARLSRSAGVTPPKVYLGADDLSAAEIEKAT
jgi:hypothetical protein